MSFLDALLFIIVGCVSGFMNTVASSGTAVTLPVMIFSGIDPLVANATNRLPVFIGFLTSVINYAKSGKIPWKPALLLSIPIAVGTSLGTILIASLPRFYSELFIVIALFISLVLVIANPRKFLITKNLKTRKVDALTLFTMFIIGLWAGIIVLDSALFVLFALVLLMRYELVRANAIKSVLILTVGLISLIIFAYSGKVDWTTGALLSIGSIGGSYIGSNFAMKESSRIWVFRIIKVIISIELIHLLTKSLPHISSVV